MRKDFVLLENLENKKTSYKEGIALPSKRNEYLLPNTFTAYRQPTSSPTHLFSSILLRNFAVVYGLAATKNLVSHHH